MKIQSFSTAGLGVLAALSIASAANAGQVDLSAYVNTDIHGYTSGEDYPTGLVTIGGINFNLATIGDTGAGVIQLGDGSSVSIADNETGVTSAYVIVNSAFGGFGSNIGSLTFHGAGADQVSFDLIEGVNVRDHFDGFFNNTASDVFATQDYDGGNRYDVYRYDISSLGGTLTSIEFSSTNVFFAEGQPFLAAVTTTGGVPEPATWALMLVGFGSLGAALRRARRTAAAAA